MNSEQAPKFPNTKNSNKINYIDPTFESRDLYLVTVFTLFNKLVERYSKAKVIPEIKNTELVVYMISALNRDMVLDLPELEVFDPARELFTTWTEDKSEVDKS